MKGVQMSLSEKISKLISPDDGKIETLSSEDDQYISEYSDELKNLPDDISSLAFKNVIRKEGRCGFANGGTIDYLLNTDRRARYRVTVRTHWSQGIDNGSFDRVYINEAGGKIQLGCTDSGSIPVATYRRSVVGEVVV